MESRRPPDVSEQDLGQLASLMSCIDRDLSAFPCFLERLCMCYWLSPLDTAVDKASCCVCLQLELDCCQDAKELVENLVQVPCGQSHHCKVDVAAFSGCNGSASLYLWPQERGRYAGNRVMVACLGYK